MNHAKIFSLAAFIAVLTYGALAFYFLPLATFQGELTRMGLLPESLFGWTKPQPAIDQKLLQQASMQDADVLVVGDSFSEPLAWQTVLVQHGIKVRTESWDSMRGICADFMPWLRQQGFQGRYLVLESIERNLPDDVGRSVACQQMQYHANRKTDMPRVPPPVSFNIHEGSYNGKLSTGLQTRWNMLQYERLRQAKDFNTWLLPNQVRLARVPHGCELFSHASCEDALFLSYDKEESIDLSMLDSMAEINSRLSGVTPIWVFVPNKSTAYLYPEKQFWNEAERRFHAPNLLRMTQQAIEHRVIDLYPANNTHFSTTGYLLMGEEVYKSIQQRKN